MEKKDLFTIICTIGGIEHWLTQKFLNKKLQIEHLRKQEI